MKFTREQAFHSANACLRPKSTVTIVGPISRTWYVDRGTLVELFFYLEDCDITPIVIAERPFQLCAEAASEISEIPVLILDAADQRAYDHLENSCLCIALPARKNDDPRSAGPWASAALDTGVPVLAVHEDGNARFTPGDHA